MKQAEFEFSISTKGRGIYSIHKAVEDWMGCQSIQSGLLTVFIPHTSASLLIQENADPDVLKDLDQFFTRLVPDGDPLYDHKADMRDRKYTGKVSLSKVSNEILPKYIISNLDKYKEWLD